MRTQATGHALGLVGAHCRTYTLIVVGCGHTCTRDIGFPPRSRVVSQREPDGVAVIVQGRGRSKQVTAGFIRPVASTGGTHQGLADPSAQAGEAAEGRDAERQRNPEPLPGSALHGIAPPPSLGGSGDDPVRGLPGGMRSQRIWAAASIVPCRSDACPFISPGRYLLKDLSRNLSNPLWALATPRRGLPSLVGGQPDASAHAG